MSDDIPWMRQALALAERGRGHVEPNPMVGAVVVRGGQCVGQGYHAKFGEPHAEAHALAQAGERARGATLYVTLEPCCHHGKTPPCTRAVIEAGVSRVVAAMGDPYPQVAGGGLAELRAAGVEVELGVCEREARRLNAPYLTLVEKGRPWVIAKWAMTLDGKMAARGGRSKWITGEASRRRVHELRGRVDAIVIGSGTLTADDPLLTARPPGPRTAARIVLDRRGRFTADCQLARTASQAPVLLVADSPIPRPAGCEALTAPGLPELLAELGRRRMTNVLVEAGPTVLGSFLDAGLIDEVWAFLAPKLLGGGTPAFLGEGPEDVARGWGIEVEAVERIESDLLVRGLVARR
jgi:diaminohydroxyphosphoribosylaminopyrimidine deaminase/5-amino-6-(5-phosphoribosylamino)uracil reductase